MNVGLWWWEANIKLLVRYLHHHQVTLQLLWCFVVRLLILETQIVTKSTWVLHSITPNLFTQFHPNTFITVRVILHNTELSLFIQSAWLRLLKASITSNYQWLTIASFRTYQKLSKWSHLIKQTYTNLHNWAPIPSVLLYMLNFHENFITRVSRGSLDLPK